MALEHTSQKPLTCPDEDILQDFPAPPSPFPAYAHLLQPSSLEDSVTRSSSAASVAVFTDTSETGLLAQHELDLVGIQRVCVDALEGLLPQNVTAEMREGDRRLAAAISELLEASYELENFQPDDAIMSPMSPAATDNGSVSEQEGPFDKLEHRLRSAQLVAEHRVPRVKAIPNNPDLSELLPAVEGIREDLAWARLLSLSQAVLQLVPEHEPSTPMALHVPLPGYTAIPPSEARKSVAVESTSTACESLPSYHAHESRNSTSSSYALKPLPKVPTPERSEKQLLQEKQLAETEDCENVGVKDQKTGNTNEKPKDGYRQRHARSTLGILNDIDNLTLVIERMQHVAPRLEDQRVELRPRKQVSPEDRKRAAQETEKANMKELEDIWSKIEGVHDHGSTEEQRVDSNTISERRARRRAAVLHGAIAQARMTTLEPSDVRPDTVNENLERARQLREHDQHLKNLVQQSSTKRLSNQDMGLRTKEERRRSALFNEAQLIRTPTSPSNADLPSAVSQDPPEEFEVRVGKPKLGKAGFLHRVATASSLSRFLEPDSGPSTPRTSTVTPPDPNQLQHLLHGVSNRSDDVATKQHRLNPNLYDQLLSGHASGRMANQDSAPPTPRSPRTFFGQPSPKRSTMNVSVGGAYNTPLSPRSSHTNRMSRASSVAMSTSMSRSMSKDGKPSKMQKMAGAFHNIRRGSFSLASTSKLKANAPEMDTADLGYITEHQENLSMIAVMIYGVDMDQAASLQVEVISPHDAVLTSNSDPALRLSIALPSAAPLNQVTTLVPTADNYLETKVHALPAGPTPVTLNSPLSHPLSAPNLRSLAPKSLCCTMCDREVVRFSPGVGFKDLPSEYWAEMLEAWMCHHDPAFTAQLAKHHRDGFWPTPETVLVGGSYLLVAADNVLTDHTQVLPSETDETEEWQIVACECGKVLGKRRTDNGRPGSSTMKVSKWAIALLRGGGAGNVEPLRFSVSTFVVADMLELAQAHASHRFIIADERTGDRRIAVWLFNPSIRISYRRPGNAWPHPNPVLGSALIDTAKAHKARRRSSTHPESLTSLDHGTASPVPFGRSFRAAKILYKVIEPYGPDVPYEQYPGFGPLGQVEHLRYSRDVCVTLIDALKASTALYPTPRQCMGSFDIGFLERV